MRVVEMPRLWVNKNRLYAEGMDGKKHRVMNLSVSLSGASVAICEDEEYHGPCRLPSISPRWIEVVAPDVVRGYLGDKVHADESVRSVLLEWFHDVCLVAAQKREGGYD